MKTQISKLCIAASLGLLIQSGCASLPFGNVWQKEAEIKPHNQPIVATDAAATKAEKPWWKFGGKQDQVKETPASLVTIWSNAVVSQPRGAVRGLGGRIYFYDENHQPTEVDGDMTIYIYDDTNAVSEKLAQKPSRTVKFTRDELAQKLTPTSFGPSYSVWIPWDEVGGHKTELSLIPVFRSTSDGQVVTGKQASHLLPGAEPPQFAKQIRQRKPSDVSLANYRRDKNENNARVRQASAVQAAREEDRGTTTIKLPRSMQKRLVRNANRRRQANAPADESTSDGRCEAIDVNSRPRTKPFRHGLLNAQSLQNPALTKAVRVPMRQPTLLQRLTRLTDCGRANPQFVLHLGHTRFESRHFPQQDSVVLGRNLAPQHDRSTFGNERHV